MDTEDMDRIRKITQGLFPDAVDTSAKEEAAKQRISDEVTKLDDAIKAASALICGRCAPWGDPWPKPGGDGLAIARCDSLGHLRTSRDCPCLHSSQFRAKEEAGDG